MELRASTTSSSYHGPSHPDALRDDIARQRHPLVRNNNKHYDLHRAALFVDVCERGVARQRQLIAKLIAKGRPLREAKQILIAKEQTLLELRNYRDLLRTLQE